jgi:hypothetical protein
MVIVVDDDGDSLRWQPVRKAVGAQCERVSGCAFSGQLHCAVCLPLFSGLTLRC